MKSLLVFLLFLPGLLSAQNLQKLDSDTYAVVVGISDYQYLPDIKYAAKDARLFAAYLASEAGGNIPREHIMLLTNEKATPKSIIYDGFDFLADNCKKGDKVIFYFSGHGEYNFDSNPYYLLASNTEKDRYELTAISAEIILKKLNTLILKGVEAQLFIDAAHAGVVEKSYIDFEKMPVFLSCSLDEISHEYDDLGHGVFTYFLVEGLLGAADRDHDWSVNFMEINRYVTDNVFEYVKDRSTEHQQPVFKGAYSNTIAYLPDEKVDINSLIKEKDTNFKAVDTTLINQPVIQNIAIPRFSFSEEINCDGQAVLTEEDSFEIVLDLKNEAEYFLINQEKVTDIAQGENTFKVPLQFGINEIKVSAHNQHEQQVEQITVYSSFKPILALSAAYKMNHYGLFIASDTYQDPNFTTLNNPIYDARAMALELEANYGFEIDTLFNPSQEEILEKLGEYRNRFNSKDYMDRNDHLMIFIAGHGTFSEKFGQGYYVACDSKSDDKVYTTYLSYADLQVKIDNLNFKHILVVLDVCNGGTFDLDLASNTIRKAGNHIYSPPDLESYIHEKTMFKTRKLQSSGKNVPVYDGLPNSHSPFIYRFLDALRNPTDRVLTLQDIEDSLDKCKTTPHYSSFRSNEAGSNFLFLYKNPIDKMN